MEKSELVEFANRFSNKHDIQLFADNVRANIVFANADLSVAICEALSSSSDDAARMREHLFYSTRLQIRSVSYNNDSLTLRIQDNDYLEIEVGLMMHDPFDRLPYTVDEVLFPCFGVVKCLNGATIEETFISEFNNCTTEIKDTDLHDLIDDPRMMGFVSAWTRIYIHKEKLDTERYAHMFK